MELILMWVSFAIIIAVIVFIVIAKILSLTVYREHSEPHIDLKPDETPSSHNCSKTTPDRDFTKSKEDGYKPSNC